MSNTWEELVKRIRHVIDINEKFDFDQIDVILDTIINKPKAPTYKEIMRCYGQKSSIKSCDCTYTYKFSPIEVLYLKVLQFEYLGEIEDKLWVNDVEINANYDVPKEFVKRMINCKNQFIGGDLKTYLKKNINDIAECVYLKLQPTPAEQRRIRDNIEKLDKLLSYCTYAGRMIEPNHDISALLVISCLQVILLDKTDEEYEFYDYEYHLGKTNKPKIRIPKEKTKETGYPILKSQIPPDAIKLCLARMAEEHWYANIGKHEQFCRIRKFESKVYEILSEKIYTVPDVFEMENLSRKYFDRLMESGICIWK